MNDLRAPTLAHSPDQADAGHWEALLARLTALHASPEPDAKAVFDQAYQELTDSRGNNAGAAYVDCLMSVAHYCYLQVDVAKGNAVAELAVRHARELGDTRRLRRAVSIAGVMRLDSSPPDAIASHTEALHLARQIGDSNLESPVWNNIGTALYCVGQYTEAIVCCRRAAELATGEAAESNRIPPLSNIAACYVLTGDVAAGLEAARVALECNPEPKSANDVFFRVSAEVSAARLNLMKADGIALAQAHAFAATELAARSGLARAVHAAAIGQALVDIHSQEVERGLAALARELEFAQAHNRSDVPDVLTALVTANEAAGRSDSALVFVHQLLAHNREVQGERLLAPLRAVTGLGLTGSGEPSELESNTTAQAVLLETTVNQSLNAMLNAAITAAETSGHQRFRPFRVGRLCELFALSEGWEPPRAQALAFAARLADLGMCVIPDDLKRKPRGLSVAERRIFEEHTHFGAEVLAKARLAILQPCVPVAKFHHERWAGTGPWGLEGAAIPIEARMVALADAFDALTHERPWRAALSLPAALRTIRAEAGTRFDPAMAERFVGFVKGLYWEHDDFDGYLSEDAQENAYVRARAQIDRLIHGDT